MHPPLEAPPPPKHPSRKRRLSAVAEHPLKRQKCQSLTNYDRIQIINSIHERPAGTPIYSVIPVLRAKGYTTLVPSTLTRLLKKEQKIREYISANPQRYYEKRPPILTCPEVDFAVAQWVIQKLHTTDLRLTDELIQGKAREFASLLGHSDKGLKFSNGWLQRFKVRMGLSQHIFHGEAASAPIDRIQDERTRLLAIIIWYAPFNVYNVDETALLYCLVPSRGLALEKTPGLKLDKKRITYMFCANMDGSDKLPPLIIGRAKQPRCFEKVSAYKQGFYYFWNTKAWMVHSIWKRFLSDLNETMRRQGRRILLLCDNAPSHKHDPAEYPHVQVEFLGPNLTSWIQPMDGGIIASFKAQYKRQFIQLALERDNQGIQDIYKIDQLQAMYLADSAWKVVTRETIHNCWKHVGLVPSTPNVHVLSAPNVFYPSFNPGDNYPLGESAWYGEDNKMTIHPEYQQEFYQFDVDMATEGVWTDQEMLQQIIAERRDGFMGEEDSGYDLEDYYRRQQSYKR
ncbi:CENP-B ARS binding protein-like protein [Rhizoctonia solani]|uniref:CENP-B ARS binding protein-like protein n=1 Tax=Rhizoctonia solani TaxID=456999 RepID=A0A8H7H3R0_9AGAM|nr:CENP-B ARS binding protein-like protein [Rhizoctonia solani]